jgi:hypothetical protein
MSVKKFVTGDLAIGTTTTLSMKLLSIAIGPDIAR